MQEETNGFLKKVDTLLDRLETTVTMGALGGMTLVVLVSIVFRYVLKIPNMAGEEIARYLLVTTVFIGISMCMRTKGHMGVTVFVDLLPTRARQAVTCVADFVTTTTMIAVSAFAWQYVYAASQKPQISVATGLPMYIMYGVMAFGFSLSAIRLLMLFWSDYFSKAHPLNPQKGGSELL